MSQTSNIHSLRVKQKPNSGKVSTGANTEIFLDGAPLKGVTFLKFEFKPAKITKVQLEMVVHVDEVEGKYVIGDYSPYRPVSDSEPVDKTQEIVDALLKGGLVYAPRASGKTRALARILQQDSTAVVFCDNAAQRDALLAANTSNLSYADRVFMNTDHGRAKHRWDHEPKGHVYIDELTPGVVYPEWYAAVTSRVNIV